MGERILIERTTRKGVHVQLVDRGADDFEDQRWETICVDHGGVCSHDTRALASAWLSHPDEWCEDCMHGNGTLEGTRVSVGRVFVDEYGTRYEVEWVMHDGGFTSRRVDEDNKPIKGARGAYMRRTLPSGYEVDWRS